MAHAQPAADAMLAEVNAARTHPQTYAAQLRLEASDPGRFPGLASEDPAALADAIAFLERHPAEAPLAANDQLAGLAQAYVDQQGPTGEVGHTAPGGEGFPVRFARLRTAFQHGGEVIAYGPYSTEDAVRQLIIDSGVPDRGHRRSLFDPAFSSAGAACGPHRVYRTMCVMDLAGRAETPKRRLGGWPSAPIPAGALRELTQRTGG